MQSNTKSWQVKPVDFSDTIHALPYVIKIQSLFHRHSACRKVKHLAQQQKHELLARKQIQDTERAAVMAFAGQLRKKAKLTPEAFFRVCDVAYARRISKEAFREGLSHFGLSLTEAEVRRLLLVFDENFTDFISLDEYQQTLEAFQITGEKHFLGPSKNGKGYSPFEAQVMERMLGQLEARQISGSDLFNACDKDGSNCISLSELKQFLLTQDSTLLIKEQECIQSYFSKLDTDRSGSLQRPEFMQQFDCAKVLVTNKQLRDAEMAADDEFGDENEGYGADQSMNPGAISDWFAPKERGDPAIRKITQQMQTNAFTLPKFDEYLQMENPQRATQIETKLFLPIFKAAYPQLSGQELTRLMTCFQSASDVRHVNSGDFRKFTQTYKATKSSHNTSHILRFISNSILRVAMSAQNNQSKSSGSAQLLIEQQLQDEAVKLVKPDMLTYSEYEQLVLLYCKVPKQDLQAAFAAIPQATSKKVPFDAFKESLLLQQSLVQGVGSENGRLTKLALDTLIPGYEAMSPRSQCDSAVSELIRQMKHSHVKASSVYRMANPNSNQCANISNLKLQLAFQKQSPQIKASLIQGALRSFGAETALVSEAEFLTTFNEQFDKSVASSIPHSRANRPHSIRSRPSTASALVSAKPSDTLGLVRKLDKIFLDQGLGPLQAFKAADLDGNGVVLVSELKQAFKTYLPCESVTAADLKMTMIAFDANRNGRIEQAEFIHTFELARKQATHSLANTHSPTHSDDTSDDQFQRVPVTAATAAKSVSALESIVGGLSTTQILLKAILAEALLKAAQFEALSPSLLKTYWENSPESVNMQSLLQKISCLSETQKNILNKQLTSDSFQSLMQNSLDLFFESLASMDSPSDFNLILNCPIDQSGIVTMATLKKVFAQMHMKSQNLFFKVNSLYNSLFQEDLTQRQMILIFSNELLLKTLFTVPSQEPQPTNGVNYLIFASNVSLTKDVESQYLGEERKEVWRRIVGRYLVIFYQACHPSGATQPDLVHSQISHLFKALKQASLLQLISLLDKNVACRTNPSVSNASKALCMLQGLRVRHAPLLRQKIAIQKLLAHAEQLLFGKVLQQDTTSNQSSAQPTLNSANKTSQEDPVSILTLQNLLKQPFEEFLSPFLGQDFIPEHQLFKECQKKNKAISKQMVSEIATSAFTQDGSHIQQKDYSSALNEDQKATRSEMIKTAEQLAQYDALVLQKVDQAYRHYEGNFPQESKANPYKTLEDHVVAIKTTANDQNQEIKKSDLQSIIAVYKQVKNKPLNRIQFIFQQLKALKQTPVAKQSQQSADLFDEDKLLRETLAELKIPLGKASNQDIPVRGLVQLTAAIPSKKAQLDQQVSLFVSALQLPLAQTIRAQISADQDKITLDDFFEFVTSASTSVKLSRFAQVYFFVQANSSSKEPLLLTQKLISYCASIRGIHQDESPKKSSAKSNGKVLTQDIIQQNMKSSLKVKVQRKTLASTKGLKSQKTQKNMKSLKSQKTLVKETKGCSDLALKIVNYILPANVTDGQLKQVDHDPLYGIEVNSEIVLKVISSLVRLQKVLLNKEKLRVTLNKFQDWLDSNGTGDTEESQQFLTDQFIKVLEKNPNVNEMNILMIRFGFSQIKDPAGEPLFNLFELIQLMFLAVEQDGFNQLEVDFDFIKQLMHCPEPNEDDGVRFNLFLEECAERQVIRLDLATMVVNEAEKLSQQKQTLDICDTAVWSKCRFSLIAEKFIEQLKDPAKKQLFVKKFTDAHRQQLNYYEFFKVVNNVLQISGIQEWMYTDFESYLDDYGLALIEFSDVIEWLKIHDFDLGVEAKKEFDDEEVFKKKLKADPNKFSFEPRRDYFRGVPTILNSEAAALAFCFKVEAELSKSKQMFFDKDFGPQSDDDLEGNACSLYFKGVKPQSHPDPAQVAWKRPDDYLDGKEGCFLQGDASSNEVKQGALGDCWFIGALSVLATRDELLRGGADLVPPQFAQLVDAEIAGLLSMGVYPPLFHKFRQFGLYVLRFFKQSVWRYVVIDDRIPVYKSSNLPVFGRCQDVTELWVPLIEKAYAKLHGCYQTLISGFIDDGLADLTAMVCEKKTLHDKSGIFCEDKEKFWTFLEDMKQYQCLMGCSVSGGTEHGVRIDGVPTGIMSGHAYSLNDMFELADEQMENPRKTHRLMRVRNPWGRGEWKGKWSDMSDEMDTYEPQIQKEYIQQLPEEEQFNIGDNDGTFFINYASWRDIYNRLFVVNDFPDDWSAVRFNSQWTPSCSGGLPVDIVNGRQQKTQAAMQRFAINPQYLVTPDEDCQLFVSLAQQDGREKKMSGEYSVYPFKDRIHSAMLFLFELNADENKLTQYRDPLMKATPKVLHEISLRVNLTAGKRYLVVPVARDRNITADFSLAFYFDLPCHDVQLTRINHPQERYTFIQEEFEKSDRRVPAWKIDYLKKNLETMIGSKDVSNLKTKMTRKKTKKYQSKKTQKLLEKVVGQDEEDSFGSDEDQIQDNDDDIDMA